MGRIDREKKDYKINDRYILQKETWNNKMGTM